MSTRPPQTDDKRITKVLSKILDNERKSSAYQYVTGEKQEGDLSFDDWVHPLVESEGCLCLRVPSGEGAHYIRYCSGGDFKAVYAGPHGPENRPAKIDKRNIKQLLGAATNFEYSLVIKSPFTAIEVSDYAE
jgi:hypothetical protein